MISFKSIWLWIKNVFSCGCPEFSQLDYSNCVIEGKCYFIFSWKMRNAYHLKIKSTSYKSFLKAGSAYIAIDENVKQVTIIISNSWRSRNHVLQLQRISLNEKIEFTPALKNTFKAKVKFPELKMKSYSPKLNSLKVFLSDQPQIKRIINISYPN